MRERRVRPVHERVQTKRSESKQLKPKFGCADGGGEIPDPIPNSEVKPACGNGTAVLTVGE